MSPLGQGRRDVFLLGGEGAFADTPFVEPSSVLRLSAQQDQIQSVSMEVWSISAVTLGSEIRTYAAGKE